MKFRVDWSPSAHAELANLWNDALDRDVVTKAADSIDIALTRQPLEFGESRDDPLLHVGFVLPLGVAFQVDEPDQRVWVVGVWRVRS